MPTYDFRCEPCAVEFDVLFCKVGQRESRCGRCGGIAGRVWLPGPWTTPRTGIFPEHYSVALGAHVRSRRQEREIARKRGLVRKEDVVTKTRPHYPTVDEFEKARQALTHEEVMRHREVREQSEFEERSGLRPPAPEE